MVSKRFPRVLTFCFRPILSTCIINPFGNVTAIGGCTLFALGMLSIGELCTNVCRVNVGPSLVGVGVRYFETHVYIVLDLLILLLLMGHLEIDYLFENFQQSLQVCNLSHIGRLKVPSSGKLELWSPGHDVHHDLHDSFLN